MLRGAAVVVVAAAVLTCACESTIDGRATCPGCGTAAEPSFPPTRPRVSPPPASTIPVLPASPAPPASSAPAAPPTSAGPSAPATAAPPLGLAPDPSGYVFIETKSGRTRCQISRREVGCEAEFTDSPIRDGERANGVNVTDDGQLRWVLGNLGDIPVVTLDYSTYHAQGWTIDASSSATRFTNDRTGHGMFVSIEAVNGF